MMISTVTGHFEKFDATVETDGDDFNNAEIKVSIDNRLVKNHKTKACILINRNSLPCMISLQ
jgi:polyisoprenoid-binding protein YceI